MVKYDDVLSLGTRGLSDGKKYIVATNTIYTHYPIHIHDAFELEYVLKGSGTTIINGEAYRFNAGTLWFCTNTDFHEMFPDCECNIKCIRIKTDYIEPELLFNLPNAVLISDYDNLLIDKISQEYNILNSNSDMYFKSLVSSILIDCIRETKSNETIELFNKFSAPIGKALQIVHSRFNENISLDEVAEAVELSPNYFSTKFHNEVNQTYQQYLLDKRLDAARKYLVATNCTVTDLCLFTGFNNYVNFSKAFKKKYNMSPTQYRTQNQAKNEKPLI